MTSEDRPSPGTAAPSAYDARPPTLDDEEIARAQALARRLTDNIPFCPWRPNPKVDKATGKPIGMGPQQLFLLDFGREALYGGAAGGGKSIALMMAASQFLHVPGYSALLLRKSYADLTKPGALMDIAEQWWGGHAHIKFDTNENTYVFSLPGGGKSEIVFGYLDKANDKYKYQGGAYQFCMAKGTPVLMADGTWKPIHQIDVGDEVATLAGPRRVSRTHSLGRKPITAITTANGHTVLVGPGHRILTDDGSAKGEEQPIRSRPGRRFSARSVASGRAWWRRRASTRWGREPVDPRWPQDRRGTWRPVTCASATGEGTGYVASDGSLRASPPPGEWFAHAMLYEPALRSMEPCDACASRPRATSRAQGACELPSCSSGYHIGCGCDDAPLPFCPECGRGDIRRQDGGTAGRVPWDDPSRIRARTPGGIATFDHPYVAGARRASDALVSVGTRTALAGEADVFDLTVEGESHYVAWGGIVSANCGFDELTQHKASDYQYLFSRMRRVADPDNPLSRVPVRMRATANPGGVGHQWVFNRFIQPWQNWQEGKAPRPKRNFYPALLQDNPKLDADDYIQSLMELDPVTRAQLMNGDWNIRPEGRMFQRDWFRPISIRDVPDSCAWVRFWDMASTEENPEKEKEKGGPDYTVGALVGRHPDGRWFIADIRRWRQNPDMNDKLLAVTAAHDTNRVAQVMEQEPGSSGKVAIHHYRTTAFVGTNFRGLPSTGSKVVRASPVASLADAGRVFIVTDGTWDVDKFLNEMELFPDPTVHDDQVDAISGAFSILAKAYIGKISLGAHVNEEFTRKNPWKPDVTLALSPADLAAGQGVLNERMASARLMERQMRGAVSRAWAV